MFVVRLLLDDDETADQTVRREVLAAQNRGANFFDADRAKALACFKDPKNPLSYDQLHAAWGAMIEAARLAGLASRRGSVEAVMAQEKGVAGESLSGLQRKGQLHDQAVAEIAGVLREAANAIFLLKEELRGAERALKVGRAAVAAMHK